MVRQNLPGLSLAVVQQGDVVFANGYGFANVEGSFPATEHTVFEIGSITKPITATALMLLVEESKVDLDDPVSNYIDPLPTAWTDIRVRHLLSQTSGIVSYTETANLIDLFRSDCTCEAIIGRVADLPLKFCPGTNWSYSNTNYYLLGLIIEKAANRPYWDFLDERIFKPSKMIRTMASSPSASPPNQASGYSWENNRLEKRDPITPTAGWAAGSLVSTASDLANWAIALYSGKLLRPGSLAQMWTPHKLDNGNDSIYGLGWVVDRFRGYRCVWHNGGTAGFRAVFSHFPEQQLTVIVLGNQANAAPEAIAKGVAGLHDPALLPPQMIVPQADPNPARTETLRQFLLDYAEDNGKDMALMAPTCIAATIPEWRRLAAGRVKGIQTFTFIASDDARELHEATSRHDVARCCYYKSVTPQETRFYTFMLTADGKVADFYSDL